MNKALGFPFGIFTNDNTPLDAKYFKDFNTNVTPKTPYISVSEANTLLLTGLRYRGLTINIAGVEYWYKNGIANTDLVIKQVSANEGKITITDLQGQAFTGLIQAIDWLNDYYVGDLNADITDASFNAGVFKLTVPANSSLVGANGFCANSNVQFEDSFGLVISFGTATFANNNGNNILGNCSFGDSAFNSATGNNILGNCSFRYSAFKASTPTIKNTIKQIISCGIYFAISYTGRIDIGKLGTDGAQNFPTDFCATANLAWINTAYSNKFNNNGSPDLDLVQAKNNMTNPNSVINYEGVDDTGYIYKNVDFTAENGKNYSVKGLPNTITDPTPIDGKGYIVYVNVGTGIIGGVTYPVNSLIYRFYDNIVWNTTVINKKTNLSYTPSTQIVANDNGTGFTIPLATATIPGFITPAKFTVLENTNGSNNGDNSPNTNSNAYADNNKVDKSQNGLDFADRKTTRFNLGSNKLTSVGDTNYIIQTTDEVVVTNATFTAPRTWTLPPSNSFKPGTELIVADLFGSITATNTLTILRAGSDTINGATSLIIGAVNGMRRLISDGVSKWTFDAGVMRISDYIGTPLTANTIIATDANSKLQSLPVATYPSLAELVNVKGVTLPIQPQINLKANINSPALTGIPLAPTAALGTNTTQLATTAFVLSNAIPYIGATTSVDLGSQTFTTNGNVGIGITPSTSKIHAIQNVAEFKFNSGNAGVTPSIGVGNTNVGGKFATLIAGTAGSSFTFDESGSFSIYSEPKANYNANTLGGGTNIKLHLLNNGLATLPAVTNTLILAESTGKAIVTKEYLESNIDSYQQYKTTNFTAQNGFTYIVQGSSLTITDPASPVLGKGYIVYIISGVSNTIGADTYSVGSLVYRIWNGAWVNKDMASIYELNTLLASTSSLTTTKVDKGVDNATTVVLTSAQLNTQYPAATTGFEVYCASIIAGSMMYKKRPTGWFGITTFVP